MTCPWDDEDEKQRNGNILLNPSKVLGRDEYNHVCKYNNVLNIYKFYVLIIFHSLTQSFYDFFKHKSERFDCGETNKILHCYNVYRNLYSLPAHQKVLTASWLVYYNFLRFFRLRVKFLMIKFLVKYFYSWIPLPVSISVC